MVNCLFIVYDIIRLFNSVFPKLYYLRDMYFSQNVCKYSRRSIIHTPDNTIFQYIELKTASFDILVLSGWRGRCKIAPSFQYSILCRMVPITIFVNPGQCPCKLV